jgi:hypothetical protein
LTVATHVIRGDYYIDVRDYGADQTGATASDAAFASAWSAVSASGGRLLIPPGDYLLAQTWACPITTPRNIKVEGWGAKLFPTSAVTGAVWQVKNSFNEYLLDIEGVAFDLQTNTTADGCLEILGAHCVHIRRCTVEFAGDKDYFIKLATADPGSVPAHDPDNFNSFWCKVQGCSTRKRSSATAGTIASGLLLVGATNATVSEDNVWTHCATGVRGQADPDTDYVANVVTVNRDNFEACSDAGVRVEMVAGAYGPNAWRATFCRTETTPTFFALDTGGGAALQVSGPPILLGNYGVTGSVTTWLDNPTDYSVTVLESRYPGFGPVVDNELWQTGNMTWRFDTEKHNYTLNASGSLGYTTGRQIFGTYQYWTNTGDGKFYVKIGNPSSASDGQVVGTQT